MTNDEDDEDDEYWELTMSTWYNKVVEDLGNI